MAKSKLAEICAVLDGAHVLGVNGLRDYHAARKVRDAMRCKPPVRLGRVKTILHPYRVTVAASWDGEGVEDAGSVEAATAAKI